jgi:pimeloyl-ACP methyl ester carboxylesterase
MSELHSERLVTTHTQDGYILEGAQFTPSEARPGGSVVVWMHGFTGRFYEKHQVAIGRRLADAGHTFITGNNRGHDLGAMIHSAGDGESLHAGAWWEDVAACRFDFSAWIGFAAELGTGPIVLAGHSLGAYKAVSYMATSQDARVSALISASGPFRLFQRQLDDPRRLEDAERMVAQGRGGVLLPPDPNGRVTSAQTLAWRAQFGLDPYGLQPGASDPPVGRIRCPILFVLGSEEPEIGRFEDLATVKHNARQAASADSVYIEGADHVYRGRETTVADGILEWLSRVPVAAGA